MPPWSLSGMPMGPIELAHTVGLDVAPAAGRHQVGGDPPFAASPNGWPPGSWDARRDRGFTGGPAGPVRARRAGPGRLADRLIAPLVARTRELVAAGVVADDDLADAGVIFGTGFASTPGAANFTRPSGTSRSTP